MERIPPSARLEAQIDELLSGGLSEDGEHLAELGRLGARLVLQRAVEEEVTAFLGVGNDSCILGPFRPEQRLRSAVSRPRLMRADREHRLE